jgi:hypothetical protein
MALGQFLVFTSSKYRDRRIDNDSTIGNGLRSMPLRIGDQIKSLLFKAKGLRYISLGQRPRGAFPQYSQALKGRHNATCHHLARPYRALDS